MKKLLIVCGLLLSTTVASAASVSFSLDGRVTRIEPRMRTTTTYSQQCWTEEVPVQSSSNSNAEHSYTGPVIGAVAGGIIGNQVGKGNGKTVATAAGAVIGAFVGDNLGNRDNRSGPPSVEYRDEQRCRNTPQATQVPDGYDVTVRAQGQEMVFQMRDDPGYGTIRLNFSGSVQPAR